MIYLIQFCREYPTWAIAPVVLSSLVTAAVLLSLFRGSAYRTPLVYSALIAAISQSICSILFLVDFKTLENWGQLVIPIFYSVKPVYHLFFAIYVSFMFVPGLIAFGKISKNGNSKIGVITSYFGYVWAAIATTVGLVLMILILVKLPTEEVEYTGEPSDISSREVVLDKVTVLYKIFDFIDFSNWALVAASLVHHITQFRALKGKSRKTLMAYSTLNLISVACSIIIPSILSSFAEFSHILTGIIVTFIFVNITSAIAILLAVQYGPIWLSGKILVESQDLGTDVEKSYVQFD